MLNDIHIKSLLWLQLWLLPSFPKMTVLSTTIVPHLVSIGMVNKVPGLSKGRVIVSGGHPISYLLSAQSAIMVLVSVCFKLFLVRLDPVWLLP